MRLSELVNGRGTDPNIDILGLSADSREIEPGYLFAALAGSHADGSDFIADAIAQGAIAVLGPPGVPVENKAVHVLVDHNPRRRFALMAARFFHDQPDTVVAVTGTNGKSSVTNFCRQIWHGLGHRAASLGTLGISAPDLNRKLELTTPDPVTLYKALRELKQNDVDHLAVEASSHGLTQHRLDGVRITAAAFTNLTRDHLDYHGSEEDYLYAKMRLFGEVMKPGGVAVLNADSEVIEDVEALCWARGHRIIKVGSRAGDIRLVERQPLVNGQRLSISYQQRKYQITLPLIGDFQAFNAMMAAGLVIAAGEQSDEVFAMLPKLIGVPGRMQLAARHPSGAPIFIDFAHTPDALATVLGTLRTHCAGRLLVVFGCGGDRDAGKRPLMGRIVAANADRAIVTDDNPRAEDPAAIRAAILKACPDALEIGDRAEAIRTAISELRQRDILVITGKGHEQGQLVAGKVTPFDDLEQVRAAVAAIAGDGDD